MNRKLDDQLLRLAYGELSPEEASRVEAQIAGDSGAQKVLSSYRSMKSQFKQLSPVVPDQLSKERLREAVLSRGLEPTRRPFQPWLVAVPSMSLLLVAVALFNPWKGDVPSVRLNSAYVASVTADSIASKSSGSDPIINERAGGGNTQISMRSSAAMVASTPVRTNSKRDRGGSVTLALREAGPDTLGVKSSAPLLASLPDQSALSSASGSRPEKQSDSPKPVSPASATQVVLIDSDQDMDTGALRATEMESNANVSVGG